MIRTIAGIGMLLAAVAAGAQDFAPIAEVLRHPRCLNCHTRTDFPRQGDERRRHAQLVVRGPADHGAPTLQCSACHQDHNVDHARIPGAPHWGLAPLSMAWEDLSDAQLCTTLKDRAANGNREVAALVEHMRSDALVLWGWDPGRGRAPVTPPHAQFVAQLEAWAAAGAPCPP